MLLFCLRVNQKPPTNDGTVGVLMVILWREWPSGFRHNLMSASGTTVDSVVRRNLSRFMIDIEHTARVLRKVGSVLV